MKARLKIAIVQIAFSSMIASQPLMAADGISDVDGLVASSVTDFEAGEILSNANDQKVEVLRAACSMDCRHEQKTTFPYDFIAYFTMTAITILSDGTVKSSVIEQQSFREIATYGPRPIEQCYSYKSGREEACKKIQFP
ncbi:MAG: hypothetical protein NTV34_09910 [Proteobacteria bacterium]|nr:hypothetical protein [Pseudomonadota bacterium]